MTMTASTLTQERLKKILHYNAESGIFTRLLSFNNFAKVGGKVGWICSNGYLNIKIAKKQYKAHRLAWLWEYGNWPEDQIDHINGCRTDNRLANLRAVSQAENLRNMGISSNNVTGHRGVRLDKRTGRYYAYIGDSKKGSHIGSYATFDEARDARLQQERLQNYHPNHGRQIVGAEPKGRSMREAQP